MFKIDLHIHTLLGGDSVIEPETIVPLAKNVGLDAVCITEHHDYNLSKPFEAIARRTGFPILRAMEYRANEGHLLIFGVPAGKGDLLPGLPIQTVIAWVDRRGGVAIPAHPFQTSLSGQCLGSRVLNLTDIAALETINASATDHENHLAQTAAEQMNLPGIGGSDAHGPLSIGRAFTLFPMPIHTIDELVYALKSGRYRAGESGP